MSSSAKGEMQIYLTRCVPRMMSSKRPRDPMGVRVQTTTGEREQSENAASRLLSRAGSKRSFRRRFQKICGPSCRTSRYLSSSECDCRLASGDLPIVGRSAQRIASSVLGVGCECGLRSAVCLYVCLALRRPAQMRRRFCRALAQHRQQEGEATARV